MTTLDYAITKRLGDQLTDRKQARLRAEQETALRNDRSQFLVLRDEANAQRTDLEAHSDGLEQFGNNAPPALTVSLVSLPEKLEAKKFTQKLLEVFQLLNGLTRSPTDPQIILSFLFIGILAFIETGTNASFFSNAYLVASPLAALLISLLISITNVSVSASAGYFIGRWTKLGINAPDSDAPEFKRRRWIAKAQFWAVMPVIGLFQVTVGLVRSQENLETVEHSFAAYIQLLTTPEALFLLLTGIVMSVLAYHKGLNAFDDPYPGYGERHRAVLRAENEILHLYEDAVGQIEEHFDKARETLTGAQKKQQRAIQRYNRTVAKCRSAYNRLEHAVGEAESALRTQITQRTDHLRAVAGEQFPASVPSPDPEISLKHLLEGCEVPDSYQLPDINQRLEALNQAKSEALKQLSNLFQDALEKGEKP